MPSGSILVDFGAPIWLLKRHRKTPQKRDPKEAPKTLQKKPVLARNGKRAKIKHIWPASDQIFPKPPAQNLQHLTSSAQPRHLQGTAQPLPNTCPESGSQSSYHVLWSSAALRAASTTPHCDLRRSGAAQHLPKICLASARHLPSICPAAALHLPSMCPGSSLHLLRIWP